MNLFGDKLEQGVLEQFGEVKPHQTGSRATNNENFSEIMVIKKATGLGGSVSLGG